MDPIAVVLLFRVEGKDSQNKWTLMKNKKRNEVDRMPNIFHLL